MRNSIMAQLEQQLAQVDRVKLVRRDRAFKVAPTPNPRPYYSQP